MRLCSLIAAIAPVFPGSFYGFAQTVGLHSRARITNSTGVSSLNPPSTGSGKSYASACNAAKQSWVKERGSSSLSIGTLLRSYPYAYLSIPPLTFETFTFLVNSTAYTLCDGYPRLDGRTCILFHTLHNPPTLASALRDSNQRYYLVILAYPLNHCLQIRRQHTPRLQLK